MTNDPLARPPTGYLGLATFVGRIIQHLALDGDMRAVAAGASVLGEGDVTGHPVQSANLDGPVSFVPVK